MFPYLRVHVLVRAADGRPGDGALTSNILRRVLGNALVKEFCPFNRPVCQEKRGGPPKSATERCGLAGHCPYGVLFARSHTQRPPFALYISREVGPGGLRTIELSLYGPGCAVYSWTLLALQLALARGLGKKRQPWIIDAVYKVRYDGSRRRLCDSDLSQLSATIEPEHFSLTSKVYIPPRPLTVELLSPTRLIHGGHLLPRGQKVPFDLLINRVLDRFRELYGTEASGLVQSEIRPGIEEAAARVSLIRDETQWVEVKDYSARTRRELQLGGLTGRLYYDRPAMRFLPILKAGEILHLGKNPTSGCGRLRLALP